MLHASIANAGRCRWLVWAALLASLSAHAAAPGLFAARSSNSFGLAMFAIIAGLVMVGAIAGFIMEAKRREALQLAASRMGFQFLPDASIQSVIPASHGLELFSLGRSPRASNVLQTSAAGVSITIFDFQYTTGSGKNQATHRQTVALFQAPGATLPAFSLRPENFLHKIGATFGYQDIDFSNHPKFSAHYLLRGPDEAAIRAAFNETVLGLFENQPDCCVEAAGPNLIIFRHGHCVKPENIPAFLETGLAVMSVFGMAHLSLSESGEIVAV
jgi:hypothetical protein